MSASSVITVISGPSGSGKNSIIREAAAAGGLSYVTSATTREIRTGERQGVDYYYMTHAEFDSQIQSGNILEWDAFCGNKYGTLRSELASGIAEGRDLILDLTISGAFKVKKEFPENVVTVFVLPPSIDELEKRLRLRLRETQDQINERVSWACSVEIPKVSNFDYIIVNDVLKEAAEELLTIIRAEKHRSLRNADILNRLGFR